MLTENQTVTIWIIGDSIFQTYEPQLAPLAGIGQALPKFCKPDIKVENRAVGGTSTKSFRDMGYWKPVIDGIKKGDYLLIKFGHNDQKKKKPVVYAEAKTDYYQNLSTFIKEAKTKGANPILITSMCRRHFRKERLLHTLRDYPKYCRLVAKEQNIPLIDLNNISSAKISAMGKDKSKKLYNHVPEDSKYTYWTIEKKQKSHTDNSHLNLNGAKTVAKWLVDDAKEQKLKLAELFK
jgi:DNA sulfur modification protein DndE